MRVEQAIELIENTVQGYYAENKEEADMEELLQLIRKVNYRTKKLKKQIHNQGSGEHAALDRFDRSVERSIGSIDSIFDQTPGIEYVIFGRVKPNVLGFFRIGIRFERISGRWA